MFKRKKTNRVMTAIQTVSVKRELDRAERADLLRSTPDTAARGPQESRDAARGAAK